MEIINNPSGFKNEFHIKELYRDEFKDLISRYFQNFQVLEQKYISGISMIFDEKNQSDYAFFSGNYNEINTIEIDGLYLIAIVSNTNFIHQKNTIFDGSVIEKTSIYQEIIASNTYKTGYFILKPLKFLKRIIKKLIG